MNVEKSRMVTRQEAARLFGCSPGTLANWLCQGKGPRAFKIGKKKILYKLSDLEVFFTSQPVETVDSMEIN